MYQYFIILFIILSSGLKTFACIQESRVLLNGEVVTMDEMRFVPYGRYSLEDTTYFQKELHELDSLWKTNKNIDDYSDYGVILVYLGRYEEAKDVFIEIEKLKPGRYTTAANLGTTYELLGQNHKAWTWIKKALKIDPTSHENSEWLHIKILDAKIKGEQYITTRFLLRTVFGEDSIPKSRLSKEQLIGLRDALYYQLNERVSFVKPKDKIVALLLFELGNICAITDDITTSLLIYDRAKEYGYASSILNKRYAKFKILNQPAEEQNKLANLSFISRYLWWWTAGGMGLLLTVLLILIKKRKK